MSGYGQYSSIRDMPPDELAPILDWDDFNSYALQWEQDQHLAAVGPTGQGKSTTIHGLLDIHRDYVAYLATKPKDETLDAYLATGKYVRTQEWPMKSKGLFGIGRHTYSAEERPRRLVWPDATSLNSEARQQAVFSKALDDIYVSGGWCVVWDDYWYLCHILGMEKTAKKFLMNARSNHIPFVLGAQRPAGNKLVEIFDQAQHLLFFRDNDETNLKRIGSVGWLNSGPIRAFVANLDQYQCLYVNTRTGDMYRTTAPELQMAA